MSRSAAKCLLLHLIIGGSLASHVQADDALRLPSIFDDHMVVQRERPLPVWGWGTAGQEVTVTLGDTTASTVVAADGTWHITLPGPARGRSSLQVKSGTEALQLQDVLVGEVWVCAGQSNMAWPLKATDGGAEAIAGAHLPQLRLFTVKQTTDESPQDDCQGQWTACTPEAAADFSAVAYYFGKRIADELEVPVGLVGAYWGGTPAEAWTSQEAIDAHDLLRPMHPAKQDTPLHHQPSTLYNGMIAPLVPFAIRGAIWYQGESNVGRAHQYATLFPTMIRDWRYRWRQGEFPFYFVQLAPFRYGWADPAAYAELCEAQTRSLSLSNTGMVVTNDIGNVQDIHPRNKRDVGARLARWALAETYHRSDVVHRGPEFASHSIVGDSIRIYFDHAEGLKTRDGKQPTEFTIAGADGQFLPAEASIVGATVVVRSAEIALPTAVRFAWHDSATPNLVNNAGLPAAAFRTDDCRLLSEGKWTR